VNEEPRPLPLTPPPPKPGELRCRECGCREVQACINAVTLEGCSWAEPDLCSACVPGVTGWYRPGDAYYGDAVQAAIRKQHEDVALRDLGFAA
jgi:hypothetical protein